MRRSEAEVERLVRENQKLVDYMVNRYLKRYFVGDMEREDLVSWGMIGLLQAARAWDPERSRSFSTLACKAIERMIVRGVSREWKPEQAALTMSLDDLISDEKTSSPQELFVELGLRVQHLEHVLLVNHRDDARIHRDSGGDVDLLSGETSFPEKVPWLKHADNCLLASRREH